jgi:hypothetical protein
VAHAAEPGQRGLSVRPDRPGEPEMLPACKDDHRVEVEESPLARLGGQLLRADAAGGAEGDVVGLDDVVDAEQAMG